MSIFNRIINFFRKEEKEYTLELSKHSFKDPLYPPDLAEVFDLNRNEIHSDICTWRNLEKKPKK